jgi:hypothetical protein
VSSSSGEQVHVANRAAQLLLLGRQFVLLLADERPDFITLDVPQRQTLKTFVQEVTGALAKPHYQPPNAVPVHPRDSLCRTNRVALAEQPQDHHSRGELQRVSHCRLDLQ